MAKQQDTVQSAREAYSDAMDEMRETHARIIEDLRFSNPSDPQQWPSDMLKARVGRPNYVFDRTNQFISQVVNDARQNKPSISCMPADSQADPEVAEMLDGMIRHIEYVSRAGIAYDTAIELSARGGLGWLRVVPEVMRPETNEQEIRILRVHDPLSCMLEAGWTQPDGSDAMRGWATTRMSRKAFERAYPKATNSAGWVDAGQVWTGSDSIVVAEEFEITEKSANMLRIVSPAGEVSVCGEDDYWTTAKNWGFNPQVVDQFTGTERSQKWRKLTGCEVLEETDFPSQYLPIIPVLGFELWIEGKRHLCGLTRRLMDGQRLHNYEMSAWAEAMALQPKAPFIADARAIAGLELHWQQLNTGNPSFLPYNSVSDDGTPIPPPQRLNPPTMPTAFAQGAVMASQEMEAAVGMFKANLGQQGNETSGRAINARKVEGDVATFHFVDNLSRSIEQLGRCVVDMIPRIYDTQRRARVLGLSGKNEFVQINPDQQQAIAKNDDGEVVAINPNVGAYDVRVKAGPSYTTQRQEVSQQLTEMIRGNPAMMAALGPMWARMQDFPEADELAKHLLAIAPPQIQALEQGGKKLDAQTQAQMQQMKQQIEQLTQMLQQATQAADQTQAQKDKDEADMLIKGYDAVTKRLAAVPAMTPEMVQSIAMQTWQQAMQVPPVDPHELGEMQQESMMPPEPEGMDDMPPDPAQMQQQQQPPQGGFFTPEGQ